MENNKTNIIIASFLMTLMLFIIFFGLFDRFDYEKNTKSIYLSANYTDLKENGADILKTLAEMKKNGIGYVTVSPVTFSELKSENKFDTISYSSVKINEDDISLKIKEALKSSNLSDDDVVIISSREDTTAFLTENLINRYDVIKKNIDDKISIFCVKGKTKDDDFIIGYDSSEISNVKKSGLKLALSYPAYTFENEDYEEYFSGFLFKNNVKFIILRKNENENKIGLSDEFKSKLRGSEASLVVFENENQQKNETAFIFKDMRDAFVTRTVRGFNMDKTLSYDKTAYRFRYYQWYNSAIERNTTFLNANILKNENKSLDENISLTLKAASDFTNKMKSLGYSINTDREDIPYRYNLRTAALCGGIVIVILIYLYLTLLGIAIKSPLTTTAFASIFSMVISYPLYNYVTKFYAIIIMILITALLSLIIFKTINSQNSLKNKLILCFSAFMGFMLFGSLLITAMFSSLDFYLGNKWIFGVKLSLLVPFLFTAFNYNSVFLKLKTPKEAWEKLKEILKDIPKYIIILCSVAVVLAAAYYIIRTGKSDLILPLEDIIRKRLTDIFIIRPRFKEFLIGYPCFALFIYVSLFRKNKKLQILTGILSTLLFTSILNTFCHAFTDFRVSLIRTLNGFILGVLISAALILICELIIRFALKKNKTKEKDTKDELTPVIDKIKAFFINIKDKIKSKKPEEVKKTEPKKESQNKIERKPIKKNKPQKSTKKNKKNKKKKKR